MTSLSLVLIGLLGLALVSRVMRRLTPDAKGMDMRNGIVPKKGEGFLAFERASGHAAYGGPFVCLSRDNAWVHARDAGGNDRVFDRSVWRFEFAPEGIYHGGTEK